MRMYVGVNCKVSVRKCEGSGSMRYNKDIPRKLRNNYREENAYKKALLKTEKKKERAVIPRRILL